MSLKFIAGATLTKRAGEHDMLITESVVRTRATELIKSVNKSASRILSEQTSAAGEGFDVFLSHAKADEELIVGLKGLLEDDGLTVYVDWIDDPQLDRSSVNTETANTIRQRMSQCNTLLYAHSVNSKTSAWMPWELGYFDGSQRRVGIIPVETESALEYSGAEYLGLYPYVDYVASNVSDQKMLWINRSFFTYTSLKSWTKYGAEIRDRIPKP